MKRTGIVKEYIFKNSKTILDNNLIKTLGGGLAITLPNVINLYDDENIYSTKILLSTKQTSFDINSFPVWAINCDYISMLQNYFLNIFLDNNNPLNIFKNIEKFIEINKIDFIINFINLNIIPKYKLNNILFNTIYQENTNNILTLLYNNKTVEMSLLYRNPVYINNKITEGSIDYYLSTELNNEKCNYIISKTVDINFKQSKNINSYNFGYNILYNFSLI